MGRDSNIIVSATPNWNPTYLPPVASVITKSYEEFPGSTHEVDTPWRYWEITYPRGPATEIYLLLKKLLTDPAVKVLWYASNKEDYWRPLDLQALERHFEHREIADSW